MHFTKECNLNYGPISAEKLEHDAINIEKLEPSSSILSSTCRKSFSSNGCSMSEA
jgi:hypothetical protein